MLEPLPKLDEFMFASTPGEFYYREPFDQVGSPLPLFGMESMQDSLSDLVVFGIPETGTVVQDRYQISLCLLQSVAQSFGE
jgi:hypothetical protein